MAVKKQSAGLLMYKIEDGVLTVLIAHPGGPIFKNKDEGFWGIPKGEFSDGEPAFDAARREFREETGMKAEAEHYIPLGSVLQKGGKTVVAWAFEGDWEVGQPPMSNVFKLEWPPKSGIIHDVPEIDEVFMATLPEVKKKMKFEQQIFVARLIEYLSEQQKLDLNTSDK